MEKIHISADKQYIMSGESAIQLKKIIIAIDGYSSCGKSTLAKALACRLHYNFIDSGSMYRVITLYMMENNIPLSDLQSMTAEALETFLDKIDITFKVNLLTGLSEVYLNGKNTEGLIRELKISDLVSPVSAIPGIRRRMVKLQRSYGEQKGIVMDGRDIGTIVFPGAELKVFMTANKTIRAKRRFDELTSKGSQVTMEEVFRNIEERDYADTHRAESPLRQAPDAVLLDNSFLSEQEQLDFVLIELKKRNVTVPSDGK